MRELVQRIERSILEKGLLRRGQSVLVAVSGGLDSMTLLRALDQLAPKHRWKLIVAHFNHRLRGAESDADEQLARQTAGQLGWPFVTERADVAAFARGRRLSIEMAARQLRHEFFARSARQLPLATVALAHHADDQVELFFLRLLRGAGPDALAGMKWTGPSPADPSVRLIRPLLACAKADLRRCARQGDVAFREDASNKNIDFLRNRVRHELLPLLAGEYQPAVARNVLRVMELLGAETELAGQAAARWLRSTRRRAFARLPVALQRRCLRQQLFPLGIEPDFELVERLRLTTKPVCVRARLAVRRDAAGTVRRVDRAKLAFDPREKPIDLSQPPATVRFGGLTLRWAIQEQTAADLSRPRAATPQAGLELFDAGKIGTRIRLRHWRPGDRFQPIGMRGSAKLQDLFCNLKIAPATRRRLVVAATGTGRIFWVEGVRIADPFKLDRRTTRVLRWHWRRAAAYV